MKQCKTCQSPLLDLAKFCHNCGRQTESTEFLCLKCGVNNPTDAKYCQNCGFSINTSAVKKEANISPLYGLNFSDLKTLPTQLKQAFLQTISMMLEMEAEQKQEAKYFEAFEKSGFRQDRFEEESIQLVSELEQMFRKNGSSDFPEIEHKVETTFLKLTDIFYTRYIPDLLPHVLSAFIPDYSEDSAKAVNFQKMFQIYLSANEESVTVYEKAIDIPLEKLINARASFFKTQMGDVPLIFVDQTLFGTGTEGVIFTAKAIFWKSHFHRSNMVEYQHLRTLTRYRNRLEINGEYFNVSDSFNYKTIKLLNRLRFWFAD